MTRLPSESTRRFVAPRQCLAAQLRAAVSIQRKYAIASDAIVLEKHNG